MHIRISLSLTTAGLLLTLSGGVVAQTPQTIPIKPLGVHWETPAARAAHDPRLLQFLKQKAASASQYGFTPNGKGGGPAPMAETVLFTFDNSVPQGSSPQAGLIRDSAGNLYGTASSGGNAGACYGSGCGVVFKQDVSGHKTVLYNFTGADGSEPNASLILDPAGNLYGTTSYGGDLTPQCYSFGCGVVFKLDKSGKQTVLYTFTGGADGAFPYGSLILDKAGNVYGTAQGGGSAVAFNGNGVVFKLDATGNETVLYTFTGGADGANPYGSLILDNGGNLFGTAGGGSSFGVVFKLDKSGHETVPYTFMGGPDGAYPNGSLIEDNTGALYGTTFAGGSGHGVVFKVDKFGHETVLYTFTGGTTGTTPNGGLVQDQAGNFYGTTEEDGDLSACSGNGCGVVFKLDPSGKETVLHTFTAGTDGAYPVGSLVLDAQGTLYGTTAIGGLVNFGTVYKLDRTGKETVYAFPSSVSGSTPFETVAHDVAGDLFGSTFNGGTYNAGVVYKLDRWGHETILHDFTGGADGSTPNDVILDSTGNIYGTTNAGGKGSGVVFKMDSAGKETVLYTFTGGADGAAPALGGLVRDPLGNLFGVAGGGGNLSACYGGCGVVFKVDPYGNETVLYTLTGGADGGNPIGGLVRDAAGNLYGATVAGGKGQGTVFKVDPSGKETVLHAFTGGADGNRPLAGVIRDSVGNLYGTTAWGGGAGTAECFQGGCGVVFKLDPAGNETVLHSFTGGYDGAYVTASLVRDSAGNLFGTANGGAAYNSGAAFKLDTSGNFTVLYTFTGGADGARPQEHIIVGSEGNVFGTASTGGEHGAGVVFEIPNS